MPNDTTAPPRPKTLNDLLCNGRTPTLAEIWRVSIYARNREDPTFLTGLNQEFGSRPDYRLWRLIKDPSRSSQDPVTREQEFEFAEAGLDGDPIVAWGTIALIARRLTGEWRRTCDPTQRQEIAEACQRSFASESTLRVLNDARTGCAVIRLLAESAIETARHDNRACYTVCSTREYLVRIQGLARGIDATWRPGTSISLRPLQNERFIIPWSKTETDLIIGNTFSQVRAHIRGLYLARKLDGDADELLKQALLFARSGWWQAHSQWRANVELARELKEQNRRARGFLTSRALKRLDETRLRALSVMASAARDAGLSLEAAKLNCLLLHLMPDAPAEGVAAQACGDDAESEAGDRDCPRAPGNPYAWFSPEPVCKQVALAGFRVPDRFPAPDLTKPIASVLPPGACYSSENEPPFVKRIRRDRAKDQRWKHVVGACEELAVPTEPPNFILGQLVMARCTSRIDDPDVLRSIFELCIEYGELDNANWMLKRIRDANDNKKHAWPLTADDIARYASAIHVGATAMPFAINDRQHTQWRTRLRECWSRLPDGQKLSPLQTLFVHEALLGFRVRVCNASQQRQSVASHFCGLFDSERSREFFATQAPKWRDTRRADVDRVATALAKAKVESGSGPVAISVVKTIDKRSVRQASLLVIDERRNALCASVDLDGGIEQEFVEAFSDAAGECWRSGPAWDPDGPCKKLGRAVLQLLERLGRAPKWAILAVEPDWASIPWNRLMRELESDLRIAVVPNLTWVVQMTDNEHSFEQHPKFVMSSSKTLLEKSPPSTKQQLEKLALLLSGHQKTYATTGRSVACVMGHGEAAPEGGYWTVVAPDSHVDLGQWIELSRWRLLLVHGCLCGRVGHEFLGDLSGIPGLALSAGCQLVCSPMLKIPPEAAMTLQKHVVEGHAGSMLDAYVAATRENAVVEYYNLYGLPHFKP